MWICLPSSKTFVFLLFEGKSEQGLLLGFPSSPLWEGMGWAWDRQQCKQPASRSLPCSLPELQVCKESMLAASLQLWEELGLLHRGHSEASCWKQGNLLPWQQHPWASQEELTPGRSKHWRC